MDFSLLVELLDEEFIFSRNRSISLASRFPVSLSEKNLDNIYMVKHEGTVAAAAVVRTFTWLSEGRPWKGAMVGFVCAKPALRGRGFATAVMEQIRDYLAGSGHDFSVLWTTQPWFYQRLGWTLLDNSLFGVVSSTDCIEDAAGTCYRLPVRDAISIIETVRSRSSAPRVNRTHEDYGTIPVPATSVEVCVASTASMVDAYALVGRNGRDAFLYELIGESRSYGILLKTISQGSATVYINDSRDSKSAQWLTRCGVAKLAAQEHAMWLRLSEDESSVDFHKWYVPFFDRI